MACELPARFSLPEKQKSVEGQVEGEERAGFLCYLCSWESLSFPYKTDLTLKIGIPKTVPV